MSSIGGLIGFAGAGYYCATKHAIEGFSDALAAETTSLGIKVICVEPGPFRTDWAKRSLRQTGTQFADYAAVDARMRATIDITEKLPGDPVRAAEMMIRAVEATEPPRQLVLGAIGYENVTKKLANRLAQIERWREVALAADFPEGNSKLGNWNA